jgi:hypothetical protein
MANIFVYVRRRNGHAEINAGQIVDTFEKKLNNTLKYSMLVPDRYGDDREST